LNTLLKTKHNFSLDGITCIKRDSEMRIERMPTLFALANLIVHRSRIHKKSSTRMNRLRAVYRRDAPATCPGISRLVATSRAMKGRKNPTTPSSIGGQFGPRSLLASLRMKKER
jgi:hypothetical protein